MKKILKIVLGVVITVYVIIVIFLTSCLLNYNKYGLTEFKNKTLVIIDNDELAGSYEKGTLVVVKKSKISDVKPGDYIFFYNTYGSQVSVSYTDVKLVEKISDKEYSYTLSGGKLLSSKNLIGRQETSKVYKGAGRTLELLSSKLGFLLFIIFPILLAFVYEIYALVREFKNPKDEKEQDK